MSGVSVTGPGKALSVTEPNGVPIPEPTPAPRAERSEPHAHHAAPRRERRFKLEHGVASALALVLSGGGWKAITASFDSSLEAFELRLEKKLERHEKTLHELELAAARIEAHTESVEKLGDREAAEHSRSVEHVRELELASARATARQEEQERRLAVLEGRKQ